MNRILWLASWYPDREHPFDGDFIQRHARSLATQKAVHVISARPTQRSKPYVHRTEDRNLVEETYYYPEAKGPFAVVANTVSYTRALLKGFYRFKKEYGRPDFIHVHVLMKAGLAALWLKKIHGLKYCFTEHYNLYDARRDDAFMYRSIIYRTTVKKIVKESSGMVTVSDFIAGEIRKIVPELQHQKVVNAVDVNLFHYKPRKNGKFRFIHVSALRYGKNIEGILQAFKKLYQDRDDVELLFVGGIMERLENYATELGIRDAVHFIGEVPYEEVAQHMQQSNAFVMFSRWENMPCVLLEGLCTGLPVISSAVGGIPEIIDPSNGILVLDEDVDGLYNAMSVTVMNREQYNAEAISEQARLNFSYEQIGREFTKAYTNLGLLKP